MSFINEHGEEEAGIDGGGIFKDFMENITRAAFDVQYGLFKVSALSVGFTRLMWWSNCYSNTHYLCWDLLHVIKLVESWLTNISVRKLSCWFTVWTRPHKLDLEHLIFPFVGDLRSSSVPKPCIRIGSWTTPAIFPFPWKSPWEGILVMSSFSHCSASARPCSKIHAGLSL